MPSILIKYFVATLRCQLAKGLLTTDTLEETLFRSLRTKNNNGYITNHVEDISRTVLRRSELSSRKTLMLEQSNPLDRLQPKDVLSQHRGHKIDHR
jgi:hypothetical protein